MGTSPRSHEPSSSSSSSPPLAGFISVAPWPAAAGSGCFLGFFAGFGAVFGVPAVPVAVPPPSRGRCRWRGRAGGVIGWVAMARGGHGGDPRGCVALPPCRCHLPVSPAAGTGLRAQNGRERQGSVPVWLCCRSSDGDGGFAGLYQEGTGLSPARGMREEGVRPLAGPERGQRPAALRVPYPHSLSLRWETARTHTHRHRERFQAASGKSDLILPFRV